MKVCHIVPTTPPAFNGVGDYTFRLWESWPEPKPEWHIATLDTPAGAETAWPQATMHPFEENAASLIDALEQSGADVAVLQYVPHAYNRKGVPVWLPRALQTWKARSGGKLVVVFHELYAVGRWGTLTRLLSPLARRILRQIVALADAWATSTPAFFEALQSVGKADRAHGILIPVGPNIIPDAPPPHRPWPADPKHPFNFVVFGFPGSRLRALQFHEALLKKLSDEGRIARILLLGFKPDDAIQAEINAVLARVGLEKVADERYGLSAEETSRVLLTQEAALIQTDASQVGKSGVYAACAAHGLACILPGDADLTEAVWNRPPNVLSWTEIAARLNAHIDKLLFGIPQDSAQNLAQGAQGSMKILVVSYAYAPNTGGLERVAETLNSGLIGRGYEIQVITNYLGETGHPYRIWRRPGWAKVRALGRWCDVVLYHNKSLTYWLAAFASHPVVCVSHGDYGFAESNLRGFLLRKFIARSTNVAVSQFVASQLPVPATVIPNPIQINGEDPILPIESRERDILFVGRLVLGKGVPILLEALARWPHPEKPTVTLVGGGPEEANLRDLAACLDLDNVEFTGLLSPDEVRRHMQQHRLLAVPSIDPEGLGMVVLEGLAHGCIPVASAIGGLPEAVGPCGFTLPPGDVGAWAEALPRILAQPEALAERQSQAPEFLKQFRLESVLDRYEAILERAAGRPVRSTS